MCGDAKANAGAAASDDSDDSDFTCKLVGHRKLICFE
jgi:hypothetical protein